MGIFNGGGESFEFTISIDHLPVSVIERSAIGEMVEQLIGQHGVIHDHERNQNGLRITRYNVYILYIIKKAKSRGQETKNPKLPLHKPLQRHLD